MACSLAGLRRRSISGCTLIFSRSGARLLIPIAIARTIGEVQSLPLTTILTVIRAGFRIGLSSGAGLGFYLAPLLRKLTDIAGTLLDLLATVVVDRFESHPAIVITNVHFLLGELV